MGGDTRAALRAGYDRVGAEHVARSAGGPRHRPLDRVRLDALVGRVRGRGLVCDVGCGPGHAARCLHARGVTVCGPGVSAGMLAEARRLGPEIPIVQGDMLALDAADGAWAGAIAFSSLIHVPREAVVTALGELRRALRPGGPLLLAFHVGEEIVHLDGWWGQPVSLDLVFFGASEMESHLAAAGLRVEEVVVAYALWREQPEEIYLRQLFVVRHRRRQGLGRTAVDMLRRQVWPRDRRLTVEALVANEAAVAFWRALGYRDYSLPLEIAPEGPG